MKPEVQVDTKICGICKTDKTYQIELRDPLLACPHCDIGCANYGCTICRQGMAGLGERT
jgi:hypothetical protein